MIAAMLLRRTVRETDIAHHVARLALDSREPCLPRTAFWSEAGNPGDDQ
jgi:hypothetical protein